MKAVRRVTVFVGLCVAVVAGAADPPAGGLKGKQLQNAEQFRLVQDQLLKLAQKLQASDKPAERERAKVIFAALDLAKNNQLADGLRRLAGELGTGELADQKLERAIADEGVLLKSLQDMLALLLTDDEAVRQRAEIKRLEAILKETRDIIRNQETLRTLTDAQKGEALKKLAKAQAELSERTKALADSMAGKKSPGDPKAADKGPKDAKSVDKDGKGTEGKGDKSKDAKSGESKDGKSGDKDGKPSDSKDGKGAEKDGKPKDRKPTDGKQGQPNDGKQPDDKSGEPKDGKSDPSKSGKSSPKDSKPSDGKLSPPSDQQQQQESPPTPGRQRIEQAVPQQKGAADELKDDKKPDATKKQDKALDELNKAAQELETRLKQLREEEVMRQLAGLEARCNRMLQLQTAVYEATKGIDATVQKAGGKKDTADYQKAQTQATAERQIILEADKALELIKAEGSGVAFGGVLQEVRTDMASIERRLDGADVGPVTQEMESNVIALLKEMVAALKKQQQDMQQQQQQQQQNPQSGPQPNQELANKIAQLKLIRSLQQQVNSRTKLLGGQDPGEQTADPQRAADLRALAERQARIHEMMTALATGANQ